MDRIEEVVKILKLKNQEESNFTEIFDHEAKGIRSPFIIHYKI